MAIKNAAWLCALFLIVFSSCSMQKRHYTKGFYASKQKSVKGLKIQDAQDSLVITTKKIKQPTQTKTNSVVAAISSKPTIIPHTSFLMNGCDTIIFKSGAKIVASIKDAGSDEIKYKNCNNLNGILLTIKKSEVKQINYANGRREIFEEEHKYNQPTNLPGENISNYQTNENVNRNNDNGEKRTDGFSIAGFILSFVPFQIGLIYLVLRLIGVATPIAGATGIATVSTIWYALPIVVAVITAILCITAIVRISSHKETKKGLPLAILGLTLSLLVLMIIGLLFAVA